MSEPHFSPVLRTLAIDAQFGSASRVDSSTDSLFGDLLRRAEQTQREPRVAEARQPSPKPAASRDRDAHDGNESRPSARDAAEANQSSNAPVAARKSNEDARGDESEGTAEADSQATDVAAAEVVVVAPLATAVDAVELSLLEADLGEQAAEPISTVALETRLESGPDAQAEAAEEAAAAAEQALGEIEFEDSGESSHRENLPAASTQENAADVAAATRENSQSTSADEAAEERRVVNENRQGRIQTDRSDANREDVRETRAQTQSPEAEQISESQSRREASSGEANRSDASSQAPDLPTGEAADDRPDTRPTHPVANPNSAVRSGPSALGPTIAATTNQSAQPVVDPARFVTRVARALDVANHRGEPIQLRLHPPELGSVRLEMSVKDGIVTARFETETASARSALLDNLPALRERLSNQDMRIDRFDVDVRQDTNQQPQQPDRDPNDAGNRQNNQPDVPTATDELPAAQAGGIHDENQGTQLNVVA